MEKLLLLTLFVALLLTGCGGVENASPAEKAPAGHNVAGQKAPGQTDEDLAQRARTDAWGLALAAEDVSPTGLTLRFVQRDGAPTGELETGSPFWLEKEQDGTWVEVEPLIEDMAWDMMAYVINMDGDTELEQSWSALYGELAPGSYRLGKTVMDFRDTGDYDQRDYYAYFTVE